MNIKQPKHYNCKCVLAPFVFDWKFLFDIHYGIYLYWLSLTDRKDNLN